MYFRNQLQKRSGSLINRPLFVAPLGPFIFEDVETKNVRGEKEREQNKLELSKLILIDGVQRDISMERVGKLPLR